MLGGVDVPLNRIQCDNNRDNSSVELILAKQGELVYMKKARCLRRLSRHHRNEGERKGGVILEYFY